MELVESGISAVAGHRVIIGYEVKKWFNFDAIVFSVEAISSPTHCVI